MQQGLETLNREVARVPETMRCPQCQSAQLNTPRITTHRGKSRSQALPVRMCIQCDLLIPTKPADVKKMRIWDGERFVNLLE